MWCLLNIKMKSEFFKKKNLVMLIIIPILIAFLCTYLNKQTNDRSGLYSVAIIDYDETQLSSSLIEKMKGYDEIELFVEDDLDKSLRRLLRGSYDVVYEIKKGFQNKITNGEYNDVLVSHKEVNSTTVKWLNDQISLVVIRNWLYTDALSRVRTLDVNFNEDDFKSKFEEALADSKILSMEIKKISRGKKALEENKDSMGGNAFKILWAGIILFVLVGFGKKVVDEREKGIITRHQLSGINKIKYYSTDLIIQILSVVIPFSFSYLSFNYLNDKGMSGFSIGLLLITITYTILTWIIVLMLGIIFHSKKGYNFASQVFLLASIILGSGLLDGTYRLLDYASWFFPIKWFISFKI